MVRPTPSEGTHNNQFYTVYYGIILYRSIYIKGLRYVFKVISGR